MAEANITTGSDARTRGPAFRVPRARGTLPGSRPVSRIAPVELVVVAILIALATTVYTIYALRVGQFQNDEEQYVSLARYVATHFPGALWQSGIYPRGPQRLDAWIMAIPFALARGPGAYETAHAIQCLMFASTALPVYLLARRAGLSAPWSMLAAALAIVVPWAVVATSFLAESAAYPAYAWVLYATWMAIVHPSVRRELLALVAVLVAVLSRTAMLALVPVLPLAVLWQQWRWGAPGLSRAERARRYPSTIARTHPVSAVMIVVGAVALIADRLGLLPGRGLRALAGGYGLPQLESLGDTFNRFRQYLARAAVGTGLLAVVLGLPWTVATLVRPRDRERHATAVVCTLGVAAILLSLLRAGGDERYVLYLAAPISIAAVAALSGAASGHLGWRAQAGVLACAAIVIALITSSIWPPLASPYDFFSYPSAIFYQRVLLTHIAKVHVPVLHLSAEGLIAAAILIATLAYALAVRARRLATAAPVVLGIALLALCLTQTVYTMNKFTALVASAPNAAQRSWVDLHVPSRAHVGALSLSMGGGPSYVPIWRTTEFWNTAVNLDVFFGKVGALPLPLGSEPVQLEIQAATGLLHAHAGGAGGPARPVPRYLLVPRQGTNRVGLHGALVAQSSYLPLTLMRLSSPARVDWTISGTSEEGFMAPAKPATATVYDRAAREVPHACATFSLIAPPGFTGSWPYTVTRGGRVVSRGRLPALQQVNLAVPLGALRAPTTELAVIVHGGVPFLPGAEVSAKLAFFTIASCSAQRG
jgi:hypothetical protein